MCVYIASKYVRKSTNKICKSKTGKEFINSFINYKMKSGSWTQLWKL